MARQSPAPGAQRPEVGDAADDTIDELGRQLALFRRRRGGLELEGGLGYHVTLRLADDRVLTSTRAGLRRAARVLLARGASRELTSFGVADTHVHAVLTCSRAAAGAFAQTVETGLHHALRLTVPFEAARFRPILDQRHLGHATRYTHRQEDRHGTRLDPLRDGTSLPDLLGLRVVDPSLAARFAARLPRVTREDLLALLGVDLPAGPVDLAPLADAAAAALALPDLEGQDAERTAARRAAVHVGLAAGLRAVVVADLVGTSVRTVQRLATTPSSSALLRAVSLQLRLRAALARR